MWSSVSKCCERLVRAARVKSSAIVRVRQSGGAGRRVPKFGVDGPGGGAAPALPVIETQQKKNAQRKKTGDGNRTPPKKEPVAEVVEEQPKRVIMAAGKRIPLIKFPNRRAGETKGSKAVGRASVGGRSQAMPSLPSGTASSQPPRAKLSEAEIEAVLLGCVFDEPDPKKAAPKKK